MNNKFIIPALLSIFIVGFGQIIKGDTEKGIKYLLWFYLGIPLIIYISLMVNLYLFLGTITMSIIFYPIFWVYNIYEAFSNRAI